MGDVLGRYATLTGRPPIPPRWFFGPMFSRIPGGKVSGYRSASELVALADKLRDRRIPADPQHALHIVRERGRARAYAFLPTSIAAFKATNDMLAQGFTLYRAEEAFMDAGEKVGAGAVIMLTSKWQARKLAKEYGLEILALRKMPENATRMQKRKIAVYGDEGVDHCMKTLGFDYDLVSRDDLNTGIIVGYDVFLNQGLRWSDLDAIGQAAFTAWFAAGGDYVGLGYRGRAIDFVVDAGLADVAYGYIAGNAIVNVDYNPDDSVAAGFREAGYAFVYRRFGLPTGMA